MTSNNFDTVNADQIDPGTDRAPKFEPSAGGQKNMEKSKKQAPQSKRRQNEKLWEKDFVELANFHVSFGYEVTKSGEKRLQTRVIHYEGEKNDRWDGVVHDQLVRWISDQAGPALPAEAQPKPAVKKIETKGPETPPRPLLEVIDLEVSESRAAASGLPGRFTGPESRKLQTECSIRISEAALGLTEKQLPFQVELYLVDLQTDQSTLVSSQTGRLSPDGLIYKIGQSFPAPPLGRYQIYVAARLFPPFETNALAKGPIIRVEL